MTLAIAAAVVCVIIIVVYVFADYIFQNDQNLWVRLNYSIIAIIGFRELTHTTVNIFGCSTTIRETQLKVQS